MLQTQSKMQGQQRKPMETILYSLRKHITFHLKANEVSRVCFRPLI